MIIVNTPDVPGRTISEVLGMCEGSTVRARNVGRDIFAGLKNLVGGEISEYTKLQEQARVEAMSRLEQRAQKMGADAIVNLRITTSVITQGAAEILIYGTAVRLA